VNRLRLSYGRQTRPSCLSTRRDRTEQKDTLKNEANSAQSRPSQAQSSPVKPRALGAPRTHLPAPNAFGARDLLAKALARDSSEFGVYRSSGLNFRADRPCVHAASAFVLFCSNGCSSSYDSRPVRLWPSAFLALGGNFGFRFLALFFCPHVFACSAGFVGRRNSQMLRVEGRFCKMLRVESSQNRCRYWVVAGLPPRKPNVAGPDLKKTQCLQACCGCCGSSRGEMWGAGVSSSSSSSSSIVGPVSMTDYPVRADGPQVAGGM